jgi:hypothetical protein
MVWESRHELFFDRPTDDQQWQNSGPIDLKISEAEARPKTLFLKYPQGPALLGVRSRPKLWPGLEPEIGREVADKPRVALQDRLDDLFEPSVWA